MSEKQFSIDLNTDELVSYLSEDFGKRVLSYIQNNGIDGKSFLSLTRERLKDSSLTPKFQKDLFDKVTEVKGSLPSSKCSKPSEAMEVVKPAARNVLHIIFQTILPAHLWGWIGGNVHVLFTELKMRYPLQILSEPTTSGYILFHGKASVPIDTIKKYKCCLLYKYHVSSLFLSDSKQWEDLHYFDDAVSRVLKLPEGLLYPETTIRQYDVPIYPKEKIVIEMEHRLDAVEQYLKESFPSTSTYTLEPKLPTTDWEMRNLSLKLHLYKFKCELIKCSFDINSSLIKDLYEKIKHVYKQIDDITVQVESVLRTNYCKSFAADGSLKECLSDWIVDLAKRLVSKSSSISQPIIPGAVLCLLLSFFDFVDNLPQDTLKLMMKLLFLKPDEEGNSAYNNLLKCLSSKDLQVELRASVQRLCCQFIKLIQGKNTDWLRSIPLPLYHFLREISEPFVPIEMNLKMEWTFWQTISDNKRNFHKYLREKGCRFQDIYLSLKDLTKFDPVLMKVLLYLCPDNQLHTIIPLTPPFLVISYLIHIFKEKGKGINEDEAESLNCCFKNLEASLSQLEKEEWRLNADKLYQISVKLIEIVFRIIQSIEKHHQTVLVTVINYYLYLVSEIYEHEEEPDTCTKSQIEKMLNLLSSWFNHHNVIGGSTFGGTIKQQKVKEELQIWILLNESVKCPDCISDLWTNQLKAILEGRAEQVSSNKSKVTVFLEVIQLKNCPEGIMDIFIVTALNGLASLKGNEAQDAVATLMKQKKDDAKIGRLLSQFVIKRHGPSVGTELTTDELLSWEVWPNFIELSVQNDPVIAEMDGESVALIKWAHRRVIDVERSLKDGSITLHELNQLVKEKEKTQRLLKASGVSIVNISSFETAIVKLKEYVDVVSTLFHSLRPCFKGYEKMREDLSRDRNSLAMNIICPTWANGNCCNFVLSSELGNDSALMQNKDTFYVMMKCKIFRIIWWTYQEKLTDNTLSQQQFVDQVWKPAINDSLNLINKCYDGSAIVCDVVIYFPSFDQETIQDYLMELQKALSNCSSEYSARIPSKNTWIHNVSKKISTYQRFRHYQEITFYLLKLKDCLKWVGNFHLLESIAEQNTYIATLNDVNEYVLKTCEKLKVVSTEDKKNCLHYLVESWEIVQWIAQGFTDLPDLQTFIDVAYTSGTIADDDLNIKKLNALRYVGNSIANFIPVLKNNSQSMQQSLGSGGEKNNNDQSMNLIQLCHNLWIFLERNKELPSLIKDCTRNLQWFKNIKSTHGAVEVNTLEELRIILAEGEFFVGSEVKEACYQISDVIYLQVDSGGFTKQYDLEELQDLESRLVLFAGQSAEASDVQRFLNVFHTICIIADMLIKLHELGCVQYIGWQRNFSFSQSKLTLLETDQRYMSQQLSRWSEAVDAARNQYHVLNSFTMKQLLHLRKELHPVFLDEDISFSVSKQTCALLQCLHPCIDPQDMNNILKEAWKQSDCNINDVSETSIIDAGDSVSIESECLDVTVDELEEELSYDQRLVYVELTEINGLDPLWSLAEIISRKQNSTAIMTNDILKHFASLEDEDQKPNKDELMKIIISNRKVQVEPTSVHKITSDMAKRDSAIADPKHLEMLDLEIHGYLSLTNLMHVLTNYNINAHQKIELIPRNRHLSAIDFYSGFPNLYVTSSAEILQTVLMIYSKDKTMPLPTQEEVLICNEKTTAEEVILLWRRAIFDPGHKRIFCLVHGEKLSYSTCEESLRELNRLKQGKKGYRLVLLCSNNENSLHFITALHSYKRSNPDISGTILKNYLLHHLIKPKHTSIGTISSVIQASSVDPHCSYVRIVQSENPGNGKSLYIQRLGERLMNSLNIEIPIIRIPIHGPDVPYNNILNKLSDLTQDDAKIIHFDIAATMLKKVESFLFYVLVLGYLKDLKGNTWRRQISQMYTIEVTLTDPQNHEATYNLLRLFPKALCLSPSNCRYVNKSNAYDENTGMDEKKLQSNEYQRVYQYLSRYHGNENLDSYSFIKCDVMKSTKRFIQVILTTSSRLKSWSEFDSFVKFLNVQLEAVENSIFCVALSSGFKSFVIKMMIEMSKEFTASSNNASPLISHPWNESCHPYLFFNKDQTTFTFIGFCISKDCHAIDPRTGSLILANVMSNQLRQLLIVQRLDMTENYFKWKKDVLLQKLATVIGLKDYYDPDPSYVITVDNIMKMMAILMRFRSGIPVVIMGETGCGKTRLLKYLCKIASQDDEHENDANSCIVVLKVHGGTTSDDIEKAVRKAEDLAEKTNLRRIACDSKESVPVFGTVLFFDEANTSEHINLIKEIMCDGSVLGRKIHQDLRVVAACNPYRKHSKVMITRLESAGLGFSTKSSQASHILEQIPLRQLVYRVNELPLSMKSLIFDFGGIQKTAEQQYIKQIVEIKIQHSHDSLKKYVDSISDVLSWSQNYMREKENECSFVSLRDVDRAVTVFIFFHELLNGALTKEINLKVKNHEPIENEVTRALIFTLGVCYHARLESREEFEERVLLVFKKPILVKQSNGSVFRDEIKCCQEVFLDNMKLGRNIARNNALRENVFMMVVCISLRIPLFLVGKPGSSKSLAKSVILNSLKGPNSESEFLKTLKEVQLFSYQCSQLSTSESILKLFSQASNVQSTWDKSKYVAVVVLDEVGLAEDSPSLPLKVLHPLLEDGTEGNSYSVDEVIDQEERVGFIGISNWALDPAKMNRGIMIIRGDPSREELEQSALQICSEEGMDKTIVESLKLYFKSFAEAYQNVLKEQKKMREFFGLRDFYSLVKMLFWMCKAAKQVPNEKQIQHVILRNFSGFPIDAEIDIIELFNKKLS